MLSCLFDLKIVSEKEGTLEKQPIPFLKRGILKVQYRKRILGKPEGMGRLCRKVDRGL